MGVANFGGGPVPDLTTANLKATDHKHVLGITSVKLTTRAARVILLIDTSGSMKSKGASAAKVAEQVLAKLPPPEIDVGLAFFDEEISPIANPGQDRSRFTHLLEEMGNRGYDGKGLTAVWSSVLEAIKISGKLELLYPAILAPCR